MGARSRETVAAAAPFDGDDDDAGVAVDGALLGRLPLATYVLGVDGTTLYLSPQMETLLGCRGEQWQGDPGFFARLLHPDDRDRVAAEAAANESNDSPFRLEYQVRGADGVYRCVQDEAIFARDGAGRPILREGFVLDVTDRVRALEAVQRGEARFRTLLSNIPGAIYRCALDSNWDMEFISDNIEVLSGYPPSDFILSTVRSYASIIHPDDRQGVETTVNDAVERHEPFVLEYRIVRADGDVRWMHEKGQGVRDGSGEVLWLDGAIFDITDRKEAELALFTERERAASGLQAVSEQAARQAGLVADQALTSLEVAKEGHDAIDAIAEAMVEIKDRAEAVAAGIVSLSTQTEQIQVFSALVTDLADQSNLLALNAAIEAAKAGEQGRGFAVVAQEVRRLAEQSKQATAQVRSLLGSIDAATQSAVAATKQGTKVVDAGMSLTGRARAVIGELSATIKVASDSAARIASSAREQSADVDAASTG
jgi:PAS domain S-box-containing protein